MRSRITSILIVLSLVAAVGAFGADQPPARGKAGPKTEEFRRLQGEMNSVLGELGGLQYTYRTADEEKRGEIQQQWKELIAKGEKIEPKLLAAAEEAYAEAPTTDLALAQFLVQLIQQWLKSDDYEPAARVGKLLVENKCPVKELQNWAGVAAFAVSDFDTAERYLSQAEKEGYYKAPSKDDTLAQTGENELKSIPYYRKVWQIEEAIRADEAKSDLPRVLLKTSKGDMELELYENEAPNTVKNFISLVQKGFYDGLTFHRVIAGFMAQGGDPKGNGTGGPDYSIPCECYQPDHRLHFRGVISMANAGRDTGGSQFFITFVPTQHLDGKHTVFGRVISGMDVLAKIERRNPDDKEGRPDKIITATVVRKRDHAYVPVKMPE